MSNAHVEELFFESKEEMLAALKSHVEQSLTSALTDSASGHATLVLSGGSTPRPFYEKLADSDLNWSNLHVTLSDERFVPADHPDSNEAMLHDSLFKGLARDAQFTPLSHACASAEESAQIASKALGELPLPIDLCILGMGNDMHTASLFPDAPEISSAMDSKQQQRCIALHPPYSPHARLSLSLPMIMSSREIILLITGDEKRETLEKARNIQNTTTAPVAEIIQHTQVPVRIFWSP